MPADRARKFQASVTSQWNSKALQLPHNRATLVLRTPLGCDGFFRELVSESLQWKCAAEVRGPDGGAFRQSQSANFGEIAATVKRPTKNKRGHLSVRLE